MLLLATTIERFRFRDREIYGTNLIVSFLRLLEFYGIVASGVLGIGILSQLGNFPPSLPTPNPTGGDLENVATR